MWCDQVWLLYIQVHEPGRLQLALKPNYLVETFILPVWVYFCPAWKARQLNFTGVDTHTDIQTWCQLQSSIHLRASGQNNLPRLLPAHRDLAAQLRGQDSSVLTQSSNSPGTEEEPLNQRETLPPLFNKYSAPTRKDIISHHANITHTVGGLTT